MSEPAELIRLIYADLSEGEIERALSRTDERFVAEFSRSLSPQRGVYSGHRECARLYRQFAEVWSELRWTVDEVTEAKPGVFLADVTVHARGSGSGIETTARGGHIWLIAGDRVLEWQLHQTVAEALEAIESIESPAREPADDAAAR